MASRLVVYIPSFENFEGALAQVGSLAEQSKDLDNAPWTVLDVVVSVNGSAYDREALEAAGGRVIQRPTNIGGDVNITLGFIEAGPDDFLWVLSDNDPVKPTALSTIAQAFAGRERADLVVGVSAPDLEGSRIFQSPVTAAALHVGLISAVVYRWSSFMESVPAAFQALWTGWGQIALQEAAVRSQTQLTALCVPLGDLVTLTRGNQSEESVRRARQGYSHSFYGGALLEFLTAELTGANGRQSLSRWWRHQWILASAYRPRRDWPERNYRATLVEALLRTGGPQDRTLWLLSLAPYWRVGLWLRKRGYAPRRWS
jgi:hypothetical protein